MPQDSIHEEDRRPDYAEDPKDSRRHYPPLSFGKNPLRDGACSEHTLADEAEYEQAKFEGTPI